MSISFPYDRNYQPSAPVVEVTIRRRGEMLLTGLVDTGADACILPVDILTELAPFISRRANCMASQVMPYP